MRKKNIKMSRDEFIKYFGNKNVKKNNKYSWSGSCCPTFVDNNYNNCGQKLIINENNDICIFYNFQYDKREHTKIYEYLKKEIY